MHEDDDARMSDDEGAAPGWEAIDAALAALYGDQAPKHYGTLIGHRFGGPDPLDGISAYRRAAPRPHWHVVTYGFSDLYDKETADPERSGYGFELSFRLADDALATAGDEAEPPGWVIGFLQNLARYVFGSGNVFEAGHYMHLNGPIALGHDTAIHSIAFARDPELPPIDTPNGRVEFLQVVGITLDEEQAFKRWTTLRALDVLAPSLPLFVTDLERRSLLEDAAIATALAEGSARDGSNTGFLYLERILWTRHKRLLRAPAYAIALGAGQVPELIALLPARLPFGRPLLLAGRDARVTIAPGERCAVVEDDDHLRLILDDAACRALVATLRPQAGTYRIPGLDTVTFDVERTEIRDASGQVVQVVG